MKSSGKLVKAFNQFNQTCSSAVKLVEKHNFNRAPIVSSQSLRPEMWSLVFEGVDVR